MHHISREALVEFAKCILVAHGARFGGHKGSSLLLLVEIFADILGGAAPVSSVHYQAGNPIVMLAISIEPFAPRETYLRHVAELLQRIESSAPAHGQRRVLLPNALEGEAEQHRRRDGIPVPDSLGAELSALAASAGVPPPSVA